MIDEPSVVSSASPLPCAASRYRARSRWRSLPLPLVVLSCVAARWWWGVEHQPRTLPPLLDEGVHEVRRVVDGDTLELVGDVRVRLLGVDTPETVAPDLPAEAWGPEASEFTKAFVAAGPIRFTFDRERRDRYGRQLAFVWHGDALLNERLIAAGLSPAMTKYPFSGDERSLPCRRARGETQEARDLVDPFRLADGNGDRSSYDGRGIALIAACKGLAQLVPRRSRW